MAAIIHSGIIESNMVTIVAMDAQPMDFLVRMNGNIVPIQSVLYQMNRETERAARGPITA
jgi:hypothetical protein